ncbi:MAG TPA: hypothetical protein VMH28_02345 [Candidatus Acidoferrales bacterium]|nr:hypothetical protein [Candidatus Acidoferrales bacterium]
MSDLSRADSDRLQAISAEIERKREVGSYQYEEYLAALREVLDIDRSGLGLAEFLYDGVPDPAWRLKAARELEQEERRSRRKHR